MSRIVYVTFSQDRVQGGHKMAYRHVETLRGLGFDAVISTSPEHKIPTWFEHGAPVEQVIAAGPDDMVVVPDDADDILRQAAELGLTTTIFIQSHPTRIRRVVEAIDRFRPDRRPTLMVVAPSLASLYGRLYPDLKIELVPCFADERLFRPAAERRRAVAFTPRKRPDGAEATRVIFERLHAGRPAMPWIELSNVTEAKVAEAFGASTLHLSLSRLESVGMTALEAMAAGCVVAGFTGVGGQAYATAENGFWAPEDDVEAAAAALAQADDLVSSGGPRLNAVLEASRETAAQWSYARFRVALEQAWMRVAPQARVQAGPMDPAG